jgi:hypothetical protein
MALSVDEYRRAWENSGSRAERFNSHLLPGSCVLETLAMVHDVSMRFVFVDDFGDAVSYCRQRLFADLVPPDQRDNAASPDHWRRLRAAFAPEALASAWAAADAALAELLDAFIGQGVTPALAERLREVVNHYSLDLELGEIYLLPQDLPALLAQVGNPFVWWDDAIQSAEQEEQPFDFANDQHRETLSRRLRELNEE